MSCQESERRIYLYQELSEREREATDRHLEVCAKCRELRNTVHSASNLLSQYRRDTHPYIPGHELTSRVMNAIAQMTTSKKPALSDRIRQMCLMPSLRYGMAAASVVLISLFVTEFVSHGNISRPVPNIDEITGKKTELNLASFHSAFFKAKETDQRNALPISACLVNCLDSNAQDCNACVEKYSKP